MSRHTHAIWSALVTHWNSLRDNIRRVNSGILFHPDEGYTLFQPDSGRSTATVEAFKVGPVVMNLPERGNDVTCDLYVVANCTVLFDVEIFKSEKRLQSVGFSTHVGYFRRGNTHLQHVYGVHYDFEAGKPGHPVFHAQLKSFATEFEPHIRDQFQITLEGSDRVKDMLQNVRLPSAELDFFSLIIQLAADHLIWEGSGNEDRNAFNDLLNLDQGILGASQASARLCAGAAIPCHRANHWYP